MVIARDSTVLLRRFRALEGFGTNPMPATSEVLFADDFSDGLNGWNPSHFSGDVPQQPVSRGAWPVPGMLLGTGSTYNPLSAQCAAYKRLTHLRPGGIVSFSIEYAIVGETDARQWSAYGIEFDFQNWDGSLRAHPVLQIASPGIGVNSGAQAQIIDDTRTFHNITAITNPVTGSTVASTQGTLAGENENKGNRGYLRLSFDLGNLLTTSAETPTCRYYEASINGYRFDLRATQTANPPGRGKQSVQGGTPLSSFAGGNNAGITLSQDPAATGAAQMFVTGAVMTYHETGWLA